MPECLGIRRVLWACKDRFVEHCNHCSFSFPFLLSCLPFPFLPHFSPLSQKTYNLATNKVSKQSILKALISESTTPSAPSPSYKYAVNSTIIQHLVPTSSLHKPRAPSSFSDSDDLSAGVDEKEKEKAHVGRRGMHSATGMFPLLTPLSFSKTHKCKSES